MSVRMSVGGRLQRRAAPPAARVLKAQGQRVDAPGHDGHGGRLRHAGDGRCDRVDSTFGGTIRLPRPPVGPRRAAISRHTAGTATSDS